jgi:hypothetical protein
LAALESFDDDHGSAAAGARLGERLRLGVIAALVDFGLWWRHGEELAGAREVGDAIAIGE